MNSKTTLERIQESGIVCGMRGAFPPDSALHITEILMNNGMTCFEMMMNSEKPIEAMQAVKQAYGDDVIVGMGTVLSVEDARRVLDAGADFVVSPAFQTDVVKTVLAADVLVAPGVATPSEAVAAWEMDVKLLKLFPIGALGVDYFKAIHGPLAHMNFMCNGAMTPNNAHDFIKAGATAVGMAGWLTGSGSPHRDDTLISRAKQVRLAVDSARSDTPLTREI